MESIRRNIVLTFFIASLCSAADPHPTERELLFQQCDSLLRSVVRDIGSFPSITLILGQDSVTTFYRPNIVHGFSNTTIPVYMTNDSNGTVLELHVQHSSVEYGGVFTETFFGSRRCERTTSVALLATVLSGETRQIISSRSYASSVKDTVDLSLVEQLHSSSIPLTRFTAPTLSFFDSILEPAIVTVASGIIIYLFFTIRS